MVSMPTLGDIFAPVRDEEEALAAPPGPPVNAGPDLEQQLANVQRGARKSGTVDEVGQVADLRMAQARSLAAHQQFAVGLQQRQDGLRRRATDLGVAERLLPILDTSIPKFGRQMLFNELARTLGVDPRGDRAKELSRTLLSLDPDTAANLQTTFTQQLAGASPGEVHAFTRGLIRGDVPVHDFFKMIRTVQRNAEPSMLGGSRFAVPQPDSLVQPTQATTPQPTTTPAPLDDPAPRPGELLPEMGQRMGYGSRPLTHEEARQRGYTGPTDPAAQRNALDERRNAERVRLSVIDRFIAIDELGYGRSDVSSWRDINLNNLAQLERAIIDIVRSVGAGFEGRMHDSATFMAERIGRTGLLPNSTRILKEDPTSRDWFFSRNGAQRLTRDILGDPPPASADAETRRTYAETAATITDRIQGLFGGMRFDLGVALSGVRPHGLSQEEGKDILRRVTTADTVARREMFRDLAREMLSETSFLGGPAYDLSTRSTEQITKYVNSPFLPESFKAQARAELNRRAGQAPPTTQQQGSVPAPTQDGVPVRPVQTETIAPQTSPATQPQTEAERLRARDRETAEAARRDTQVQQELRRAELENLPLLRERATARFNMEIANFIRAEQEAKERKAWREAQLARQARKDAEEQRDKLAAAFAQIGRILGQGPRSSGGSLISGGSGDQDSSAFRMTPPRERRAPNPPAAVSGYGNVRTLRRR